MLNRRPVRILLLLGIALLFLANALGVPHLSMTANEHGTMATSDCYMPGMAALCGMDVFEHLSWWQAMFTALPVQSLLSLLMFAFSTLALVVWTHHVHAPPLRRLYVRSPEAYIPPASPFQELFSDGILHPKLF